MSGFARVVHWVLSFFFEHRDIVIDGQLYLRRWYLRGRGTVSQRFLHHILKPDADRELHDHPWDFTTRILAGGYTEQTAAWSERQDRGDFSAYQAEHRHRISWVKPGGAWTLVHAGPARRQWGFWRENVFIPWRVFIGALGAPDQLEDTVR